MRSYEPWQSVYIVQRDPDDPASIMVFSTETEADIYARQTGGEVLPCEPVFDTAAHCHEWCGTKAD